jgi:oxygen-independent coproporphyrinogen-3 oxidase
MHPFPRVHPDNVVVCPTTRKLWHAAPTDDVLARDFLAELGKPSTPRSDSLVYIHIPFCDSFCHFCYFTIFATPKDRSKIQRYIDALKAEIEAYLAFPAVREHRWEVIYFGGGTPSVVPVDMMASFIDWLRETFPNGKDLTIEFEGEARTVKNPELLSALAERGCSRVSMGAQTLQPEMRKKLNLKPTLAEIEAVCDNSRAAGIHGINFDLLYWLPGQTVQDVLSDIDQTIAMGVTDIDYLITRPDPYGKGDYYSKTLYSGNALPMPSTDVIVEMRTAMVERLGAKGYERQFGHFFSKIVEKPRYHSNRYGGFDGESHTLGIGVSSRGFFGDFAYRNDTDIEAYMAHAGEVPRPRWLVKFAPAGRLQRILFFFPRYMVLSKKILARFGESMLSEYLPRLASFEKRGLLKDMGEYYELTDLGRQWYANVSTELIVGPEEADVIARKYWDIPTAPLAPEVVKSWSAKRFDARLPVIESNAPKSS